jgi:tellurite resistance protein TerC
MLFLDLGVFNKDNHIVKWEEALMWTGIWIGCSLLFYLFLYLHAEWVHGIQDSEGLVKYAQKYGSNFVFNNNVSYSENLHLFRKAVSLEFLTGYLIEKSLSLDNIFVMLLICTSFKVEPKYFHRVLFYGILGAIVLRFIFIFLSSTLIHHFHWLLLVFGIFLVYSGIKMIFEKQKEYIDVDKHIVVRFLSKLKMTTPNYYDQNFFVKEHGRWMFTPLFVVVLIIEFSDVIFAVDSIPAIFSVTQDPFIVFFSNIFAILGLRALFFVLQDMVDKFRFLKYGIAALLTFIGIKMSLPFIPFITFEISTAASLWFILGVLLASIASSLLIKEK